MNELVEMKKTKERSPVFPFIPLEQALERARQFYSEEKRGAAPYARAAMHWKYSATSSGGLQTVGALKSYGLLGEAGGAGANRQLRLTELALRILLDQRPDSSERLRYIREAVKTPSIASDVYNNWPDGLPSDGTLNHFLVLDKKFNQATALKVVKILKENHILARFSDEEGLSSVSDINDEERFEEGDAVNPIDLTMNSLSRQTGIPMSDVSKPRGHSEQVLGPNGEIISIQFSETPTVELYEFLRAYADFKVVTLRGKSKSSETTKDVPPQLPG